MESFPHQPVLLNEVLDAFSSLELPVVVDGTLGAGGHHTLCSKVHPEITHYLGIDQDPSALAIARGRLKPWEGKTAFRQGNFDAIDIYLKELSLPPPNAILVDLGVSSMQLDQPLRGFSFMQEGPLDMRMNPDLELTAADIVNAWSERNLDGFSASMAKKNNGNQRQGQLLTPVRSGHFSTTGELGSILTPALSRYAKKGIHPMTLVFQALRICCERRAGSAGSFSP